MSKLMKIIINRKDLSDLVSGPLEQIVSEKNTLTLEFKSQSDGKNDTIVCSCVKSFFMSKTKDSIEIMTEHS